jgi:3-hydroxyisobutyrate dehydrogenase
VPDARVGFVGLGDMGSRMAVRIVDAGFALTVYDTRSSAVEQVANRGARGAKDSLAVAQASDIICVCVVDAVQVRAVVDQMRPAFCPGQIVLIHSSVEPLAVKDLAAELEPLGVSLLDAPVSGSRPAADNGTLTVLLGGSSADVERVRPVLATVASNILHVGGVGAGEAVKLANNVMLHMNHLVALEAVRFARSQGIEEKALLAAVGVSTGRSWVTDTWGLIDDMMIDHPQAGTDEIYATMSKDMWQAVVMSRQGATAMPLTALGTQLSESYFRERQAYLSDGTSFRAEHEAAHAPSGGVTP